jgi:hypothetical protein
MPRPVRVCSSHSKPSASPDGGNDASSSSIAGPTALHQLGKAATFAMFRVSPRHFQLVILMLHASSRAVCRFTLTLHAPRPVRSHVTVCVDVVIGGDAIVLPCALWPRSRYHRGILCLARERVLQQPSFDDRFVDRLVVAAITGARTRSTVFVVLNRAEVAHGSPPASAPLACLRLRGRRLWRHFFAGGARWGPPLSRAERSSAYGLSCAAAQNRSAVKRDLL